MTGWRRNDEEQARSWSAEADVEQIIMDTRCPSWRY